MENISCFTRGGWWHTMWFIHICRPSQFFWWFLLFHFACRFQESFERLRQALNALGPRGKFHVWCAQLLNCWFYSLTHSFVFPVFVTPLTNSFLNLQVISAVQVKQPAKWNNPTQNLSTKLHCCWGLKGTSLRSMELARVSREISFSQREVQSAGFQKITKPEVILSGVQWIQQVPLLFEAAVLTDQPAGNPSKKMDQFWWGSKFWGS